VVPRVASALSRVYAASHKQQNSKNMLRLCTLQCSNTALPTCRVFQVCGLHSVTTCRHAWTRCCHDTGIRSRSADLRTPGMVRGEGVNMVRCVALAALATVPKSPLSSYCFLIRDSCRPVAAASACHDKNKGRQVMTGNMAGQGT
jgi:hypothetical protein